MRTESSPSPADRTPLPLIRLEAAPDQPGPSVTARVQLSIGGQPAPLEITVPTGPTQLRELLPIFQGLTDVVVGVAVQKVEHDGLSISCRKGCGACCRQPVPVAETEARALARLVAAMPEPRQSQVRARFAEAVRRVDAAGLLDAFRRLERPDRDEVLSVGLNYFYLGVACPFLEEESCSIHRDRPLACREYLVTSPAEECARPTAATVRMIPLPAQPGRTLRVRDRQQSANGIGWVPLILALEWSETHPEGPPSSTGAELIQDFFARLAQRPNPADNPGSAGPWVPEGNLQPLLTALGWVAGADFGEGDWAAVSRGVQQSDGTADRWYEHALAGRHPIRLHLAHDRETGTIRLRVESPAEVEPQVQLALAIFQQFRLLAKQ